MISLFPTFFSIMSPNSLWNLSIGCRPYFVIMRGIIQQQVHFWSVDTIEWGNIASRRFYFCTIMEISRKKEALLLFQMTSRVLYIVHSTTGSTVHSRHLNRLEHCRPNMNNYDDKYPAQLGFEPGTSRLQAPVDTNEPSGPAWTQ